MYENTIAIAGVGNMGRVIARAMEKLGYSLLLLDKDEDLLKKCSEILTNEHPTMVLLSSIHNHKAFETIKECKAVVSALPYFLNYNLARCCAESNVPYFDLGGSVHVSDLINSHVAEQNGTCLTDLGLAPGWANIIAEHMCKEQIKDGIVPKQVNIMVGGLPIQPTNTLKYGCNWSIDGLLNEYKEDCVILKDGLITLEKGLDGLATVKTSLGELEAFYTSGGISHTIDSMYKKGVQNCSYKTLRYPGHNNIIKFLVRESGLTDSQIRDVLKVSCPETEDLVIIRVEVDNKSHEEVIMSDHNFSAMQKATAFAAASAVSSILSNKKTGILGYGDIHYTKFTDHLNHLLRE